MSTSTNKAKFRPAFVPTTALAKSAHCDEHSLIVSFTDGRVLSVPLAWFPLLHHATAEQRTKCEIHRGGASLHWPEIDEDLSVAGLMSGVDWQAA